MRSSLRLAHSSFQQAHHQAQSLRLRLLAQVLAAAARTQAHFTEHQEQADLAVNTSSSHKLHLRLVPLEER
jgi:hypothetical protein